LTYWLFWPKEKDRLPKSQATHKRLAGGNRWKGDSAWEVDIIGGE
jgi:hypothetical protein